MALRLDLELVMPRGPRLNVPDGIYHVMTRGNRKGVIFEDDRDRAKFIDIVAESAERHAVRVFAEARLGNHYHQIVQTPRANLPEYMGYVNGTFTQFSNHRHQRTGHLFNERYKPVLVDNASYLRIAIGYVVMNAVNHGFVDHPGDWKWSSYRATVGLEPPADYLCLDWLASAFPAEDLEGSRARFCLYLEAPMSSDAEERLARPFMGSSQFDREVREHIDGRLFMASLPRSYRALDRPPLTDLFQPSMTKVDRNAQMLRAHLLYAYSMSEIARALCMHPASVSRIVAQLRRQARHHRGR